MKALIESFEKLLHLHDCEQEGLTSGQPTPEQWFEAVENAKKAMEAYANTQSGTKGAEGVKNNCVLCGNVVGNTVFTVCDDCWDKGHNHPQLPNEPLTGGMSEEEIKELAKTLISFVTTKDFSHKQWIEGFVIGFKEALESLHLPSEGEIWKEMHCNLNCNEMSTYDRDAFFNGANSAIKATLNLIKGG